MKKILYICSVNKHSSELRFIEEISLIEHNLIHMTNHPYVFRPKIGVHTMNCRQIVLNESPDFIHFSLHGEALKGLEFVQWGSVEPGYLPAIFFVNLFKQLLKLNKKISCVVFSACHSKKLAELVLPYLDFAIGIEGDIEVDAMLHFNEGFYSSLFVKAPIRKCFETGIDAVESWEQEEGIVFIAGSVPASKKIHLLCNS